MGPKKHNLGEEEFVDRKKNVMSQKVCCLAIVMMIVKREVTINLLRKFLV